MYDFTVADRTNVYRFVAFGQVDTSALRHILKNHGGAGELLRGQMPITRNDLLLLPEMVRAPDRIENAGRTKQGRDTVRYYKQVDGDEMVYVAEVRPKRYRLAAITLYRSRLRQDKAPSPTPDAPS